MKGARSRGRSIVRSLEVIANWGRRRTEGIPTLSISLIALAVISSQPVTTLIGALYNNSISTSPPSIFTGYTATFAPGGPASPVFGSHSQPCQGQTTFPPEITPWPSGPPRCRQTLSMALISPFTLATQMVLSPQGNSLASLRAGRSDSVAILTNGIAVQRAQQEAGPSLRSG